MMKTLFLVLGLCLPLPLLAGEIIFQKGLNGYEGAADGMISGRNASAMTQNFWGSETLVVSGTARGGARSLGLIFFENLFGSGAHQIPVGAKIRYARLELSKVGEPKDQERYTGASARALAIVCYRMLTGFQPGRPDRDSEAYACFHYRSYFDGEGEFWGDQHRLEDGPVKGVDYQETPVARIPLTPGTVGNVVEVDVTELVSGWAAGEENHGLLLTARGFWIGAYFASSQHPDTSLRPRLIVGY